ncbi:MAG: riboflavin synthase subunit alpha [Gammaproteobacteria bacterium]|nr:riboflavin synthase subunit alpha [Gammaproteobacteria bacterium]
MVQGTRRVVKVERTGQPEGRGGNAALSIDLADLAEGLQLGGSVAVNGCCVTAAAADGSTVRFDLIRETLATTNLGDLRPGSQVNVERSLRLGDEVGGHLLSGHVSATVPVVEDCAEPGYRRLTVRIPGFWMRYLSLKGFVALNGASLTVAQLDREASTVAVSLIPETLKRTTFGDIRVGDRLNLEVDPQTQAVVDTVRSMLPDLPSSFATP